MPPSASAIDFNRPVSSPPRAKIRFTPPAPLVAAPQYVLADSALRAALDEFLTKNGNQVRLTRIQLEGVGPEGEAQSDTHMVIEGVLLKPLPEGYQRIDLSLGWSQKTGFQEGRTTTQVDKVSRTGSFPIDLGLCLTVERLIATLKAKGRPAKVFHRIAFGFSDASKDHPVWSIDFTRNRALFGPRREQATVDDITGESQFQLF